MLLLRRNFHQINFVSNWSCKIRAHQYAEIPCSYEHIMLQIFIIDTFNVNSIFIS